MAPAVPQSLLYEDEMSGRSIMCLDPDDEEEEYRNY